MTQPDSEPSPHAPATDGADARPKEGMTSAAIFAALRQLGPAVSTLAIASVVLPGALGGALLTAAIAMLSDISMLLEVARSVDPAQTARVLFVAAFVYAGVVAFVTGSMILPTYAVSFVAGVFFGLPGGVAVALTGATCGALLGYGWGCLLARGRVMSVIERHEKASVIRRAIIDRTLLQEVGMVALIRLPVNSPFALTNLLMSSTGVRLGPYTLGSLLGIAPRTVFYVWAGAQAQDIAEAQDRDRTTQIVLLVVGIAIFYGVYKLMSRWAREALKNAVETPADAP